MPNKYKEGGIQPEEFTKAFGDNFWELPVEDRFEMLVKRCLGVQVKRQDEDAPAPPIQSLSHETKT